METIQHLKKGGRVVKKKGSVNLNQTVSNKNKQVVMVNINQPSKRTKQERTKKERVQKSNQPPPYQPQFAPANQEPMFQHVLSSFPRQQYQPAALQQPNSNIPFHSLNRSNEPEPNRPVSLDVLSKEPNPTGVRQNEPSPSGVLSKEPSVVDEENLPEYDFSDPSVDFLQQYLSPSNMFLPGTEIGSYTDADGRIIVDRVNPYSSSSSASASSSASSSSAREPSEAVRLPYRQLSTLVRQLEQESQFPYPDQRGRGRLSYEDLETRANYYQSKK
jgi:hypothetical protein